MPRYAGENLVGLDIFIQDPYVQRYLRREKITVISLIGNIGGLLGLFVGFSFISVIEVAFMFCLSSTSSKASSSSVGPSAAMRKGRTEEDFDKGNNNLFRPSF